MDALLNPELWIALITLAALEIVLGIDNIIFLSIMANKLPEHQRARARTLGLAGACLTRVGLLLSLAWLARLTTPLFEILGHGVSGRDIILFGGGLFLLGKSTLEIHEMVESPSGFGPEDVVGKAAIGFSATIPVDEGGMAAPEGLPSDPVTTALGVYSIAAGFGGRPLVSRGIADEHEALIHSAAKFGRRSDSQPLGDAVGPTITLSRHCLQRLHQPPPAFRISG